MSGVWLTYDHQAIGRLCSVTAGGEHHVEALYVPKACDLSHSHAWLGDPVDATRLHCRATAQLATCRV